MFAVTFRTGPCADAGRLGGAGRRVRLGGGGYPVVKFRQLKPAVAVRGPYECDVDPDVVEPDDVVHPTSFDRRLSLQLHTKFDKERDGSLEVVDNDADVVHPLNRHGPG